MTLVKVNNQRPLGRLVDDFFGDSVFGKSFGSDLWQFPATNIHETPDAYHLELNVPGRTKEDFKISVDNGVLTVGSEKKEEARSEDYKTVSREFTYRSFSRSFTLDNLVDVSRVQAKYENGVLKIFLPKKEEVKQGTRQVNID